MLDGDWSSDVCSSDLEDIDRLLLQAGVIGQLPAGFSGQALALAH
jgi:hypothetical protein